jgi:hypothetical protein
MGQMEMTYNMCVGTRSAHTILVGKPPYALKMEAAVPLETLVYQTTRCHIPDVRMSNFFYIPACYENSQIYNINHMNQKHVNEKFIL